MANRTHFLDHLKFIFVWNFCHQENADEVFELQDRKRKEALAYKRSFFVRMVSDPKIYNPKIAKSQPSMRRHTSHVTDDEDDIDLDSNDNEGAEVPHKPNT